MNNVTKNIALGEDGVYRWVYEMNLYRNPTILFLTWKIFGYACFVFWLLVMFFTYDDDFWWDGFRQTAELYLIITAILMVLCLIGYLVYSLIVGGKYCAMFEMDENGVNHIQMPPQVKKAELIGLLTTLVGIAAGKPGVVGTGLLASARTSMYSSFKAVKSVEAFPGRNLIKVNEPIFKNQVYAEKEDFDFVLGFIRAHTNCQ